MMDTDLYKADILCLKLIPWVLAIIYLVGTIFSSLGIDLVLLSFIGSLSLIPALFIILSSFTFKFCIWHRLPLYFILVDNTLNWIFWSILGCLPLGWTLILILISLGVISILGAYFKNKHNEQVRNSKNVSSTSNK